MESEKLGEEEKENTDSFSTINNTSLPTIMPTYAHPITQVERALALVLLHSATESIRVKVAAAAASTNFANLRYTLPRKFSDPEAVLKEMFPGINPIDPRILGLQHALRGSRENAEAGLHGVSKVILSIEAQTSSN